MTSLLELEQKLRELDTAIVETRKRLPAHSVKPPVMMDLLDLEDQYDVVLNEIRRLKEPQAEA
ncbi:MAG: hypothetical protein AB7S77_22605 [Desulfatirhabdiaceae bacterium]